MRDFFREETCLVYERWMRRLGGIYLIFLGKDPVVVLSGGWQSEFD